MHGTSEFRSRRGGFACLCLESWVKPVRLMKVRCGIPRSSTSGYVQPKFVLWLRCGNCRSRSGGGVLGRCRYFRLCRRRVGVQVDGLEERC